MMKRFLCALPLVLLLSACVSGQRPVEMRIVEEGRVFAGAMNIGPNVQDVLVRSEDGSMECKGVSLLGYAVPGCASAGSFRLECSDGRVVAGDWKLDDCTGGSGSGSDSDGNAISFLLGDKVSGLSQESMTEEQPAVTAHASRDSWPNTYRFRFADVYAAGFGDPQMFVHPVVFEDAHSGLVIVRVPGEPLSMSLADTGPSTGQEVFVVLPDGDMARVVATSLEADGSGMLRIVETGIRDSALPVIDADGKVLGVTVHGDGITRVLGADRMRRYLRIIDPAIAAMPGAAASTEELRARLLTAR